MWAVVRRAVLPTLLLIGGLASLIYGARFHSAPVWEERETETIITAPAAFLPSFGGPPSFPGGAPFGGSPPFLKEVVKGKVLTVMDASEPALIREVSVGGVALTDRGELKRTYSGKAPSLCPT